MSAGRTRRHLCVDSSRLHVVCLGLTEGSVVFDQLLPQTGYLWEFVVLWKVSLLDKSVKCAVCIGTEGEVTCLDAS